MCMFASCFACLTFLVRTSYCSIARGNEFSGRMMYNRKNKNNGYALDDGKWGHVFTCFMLKCGQNA